MLLAHSAKAKAKLGWAPKVGLEEMFREMVDADLARLSTNAIELKTPCTSRGRQEEESGTMSNEHGLILPVIICGGAGTRLWPASRESMPKQFIPLLGEHSTFQAAAKRVGDPRSFASRLSSPIWIHASSLRNNWPRSGLPPTSFWSPYGAIPQPPSRSRPSAPRRSIPTRSSSSWRPITSSATTKASPKLAGSPRRGPARGQIMTFGIAPTFPATSYGYIAKGAALAKDAGYKVERFVEKPDASSAAKYIGQGYLWNGGYFLFAPQVMHAELSRFAPEILEAATSALAAARIDLDFIRLDKAAFERAPKTSIDYAVIEKTELAGVLPVSFSWSDVGSWDAVWNMAKGDASGNVTRGNVEVIGTQNSLVHSDELLTTVVGLDDVVVVTTPDAVLVSSRKSAESVKDLVLQLRATNHPEADEHVRVHRPWGWYQRLDVGSRFRVKRIMVKPGQAAFAAEAFSPRRALGGRAWRRRSDGERECAPAA